MSLKIQVFRSYRNLLRATEQLFGGDIEALAKSRHKIKESFLANQHLTLSEKIEEQIQLADETSEFLRQGVVQGEFHRESDSYKVRISEHTHLHDNVMLKESNQIDLSNYKLPDRLKNRQGEK